MIKDNDSVLLTPPSTISRRLDNRLNAGTSGFAIEGVDVDERRICRDFEAVSSSVLEHPNTQPECLSNYCPGGCCRIFIWLVCDQVNEYDQLQCVCNENTATLSPTASTRSPTRSPTAVPIPRETKSPSSAALSPASNPPHTQTTSYPSVALTDRPTSIPTEAVTGSPTSIPTKIASATTSVPTANPEPTMLPSFLASGIPYATEVASDESGNSVLVSTCKSAPPRMKNVEELNFRYDYEVNAQANILDEQGLVDDFLNDQVHDALVGEFMMCTFEEDGVWKIQSSTHTVAKDKICRVNPTAAQKCFVVSASEKVWVYKMPGIRRQLSERKRFLQGGRVATNFSVLINTFLFNSMSAGIFNDPDNGINKILYVNDGTNEITTNFPTASPKPPTSSSTSTFTPTFPSTISPVNNTSGNGTGYGSGEINGGVGHATHGDKSNATTPVIIALSIVCAAIVLILLFSLLGRRRRYLRQADYGGQVKRTNTEPIQHVTSLEEHVDLDSVPGIGRGGVVFSSYYEDDSSEDTRCGKLRPLHSQDELNRMYGAEAQGANGNSRPYNTNDTVEL